MSDTTQVRIVDDASAGDRDFLPGAGKASLMWSYDLLTTLARVGKHLDALVRTAGIAPGERVVEIGCGTGNLTLRAAAAGGVVTGLDPDIGALNRAARKARRRGVGVTLVRGYADRLPADDGSVDHVISSFALHHVPTDQKQAMAAEIQRVLRPGGRVSILDFAQPDDGGEHAGHGSEAGHGSDAGHAGHGTHGHRRHGGAGGGWLVRRQSGMGFAADNLDHGVARLLEGAGLVDITEQPGTALHGRVPVAVVQARKA